MEHAGLTHAEGVFHGSRVIRDGRFAINGMSSWERELDSNKHGQGVEDNGSVSIYH